MYMDNFSKLNDEANEVIKLMLPIPLNRLLIDLNQNRISLYYESVNNNYECEIKLDVSRYHMVCKRVRDLNQCSKDYFATEDIPRIKDFLNSKIIRCKSCRKYFDIDYGCKCRIDDLGLT